MENNGNGIEISVFQAPLINWLPSGSKIGIVFHLGLNESGKVNLFF